MEIAVDYNFQCRKVFDVRRALLFMYHRNPLILTMRRHMIWFVSELDKICHLHGSCKNLTVPCNIKCQSIQ